MKKSVKTLVGAGSLGALASLAPLAAHATDYNYDYSTTTTSNAAAGGIVAGVLVVYGIFLIVALALFVFWIFMLVDCLKRTNWKQESDKTLWIVILVVGLVIGLGGIAAIVYYFAVKRPLDKGGSTPAQPTQPAQPQK